MLEGLAAVDWSTLTHAYGPANDVPDLIRALDSANAKERDGALHALYGNIFTASYGPAHATGPVWGGGSPPMSTSASR